MVIALTIDLNGDFGVTCGTPTSGSLSSASVSSTQCSGSTGFANGLTYTNSKLTIACTGTIPTFSDNAYFNSISGGTFGYDGSNFRVTLPSGVLGLTLGTSISCSGSDRVSALTTDSSGKLKVLCSSGATGEKGATGATGPAGPTGPAGADALTSINSIKINMGSPTSSASGSFTSGTKLLTLNLPTGATGATGATGPQGVKGDAGTQGIQGVKGDTGATGPQGIQGVKGDTGAAGPSIPTGYTEKYACFKNDGSIFILSSSGSSCSSGTRYKILLDTSP